MFSKIWRDLEKLSEQELLLEMALPKDKVESLSRQLGVKICEHLIMCGVYGNSLNCLSHWLDKLAAWFSRIDMKEVKTPSGKLKASSYAYNIYQYNIGENINDIESAIYDFRDDNCATDEEKEAAKHNDKIAKSIKDKTYPYFEITTDLILRVYNTIRATMLVTSEALSKKGIMELASWKNTLREVFHKYGID